MALPGPPGPVWAVAILLGAASVAVLGEFLRALVSRVVPSWRVREPVERIVLDLYLGGGLYYLAAALPVGGFAPPLVFGLPVAAGIGLVVWVVLRRRAGTTGEDIPRSVAALARPAPLLALASAAALFAVELAVALPIGTGNTFDSGLLTTYTALLIQHHSIPLSFAPYASPSILYPQGTTVWLGWAQLTFGLPPARTSLLVTPLFFALAPLGAYVLGRRWFGSERGGLALALMIAWTAPWTRDLVSGSNDFVFAFPLVLLLAGQAVTWFRSMPPSAADAAAFGLLVGYSAALNPVGAEWLLPVLLIGAVLLPPLGGGRRGRRLRAWAVATGATLLGIAPSLYVLVLGHSSPGFVPGAAAAPAGSPTGISFAQFFGSIDPFLFRPGDVQLSPVPELRAELAVLIVVGLLLFLGAGSESGLGRYLGPFRRFFALVVLVQIGLLAVLWAASTGFGPAVVVTAVTSAGELSQWLLTFYALLAAVPLVLALERFTGWVERLPGRPGLPVRSERFARPRGPPPPFDPTRAIVPLAVALVILLPGVALTPTSLPPVLTSLYHDLGNVTQGDLELLAYAGTHLPSGARVLIAPGSAADFLPGYATDVVLLYPLVPGFPWTNASYSLVVSELSNATLDARGRAALAALDVGYLIVTGNSTVLWPAFSPAPLLADPSAFPLLAHYGDAYLFARTGS